jgi:hypothetical protein
MNQMQEQIMMEAQADMMQLMMSICRNKTQKSSHTSPNISEDERKQFTNCVMKFMETPMHMQKSMQDSQL